MSKLALQENTQEILQESYINETTQELDLVETVDFNYAYKKFTNYLWKCQPYSAIKMLVDLQLHHDLDKFIYTEYVQDLIKEKLKYLLKEGDFLSATDTIKVFERITLQETFEKALEESKPKGMVRSIKTEIQNSISAIKGEIPRSTIIDNLFE